MNRYLLTSLLILGLASPALAAYQLPAQSRLSVDDDAGPIGHGPMDCLAYGYRQNDCYCLLRWAESTGDRYWWSQYELCRL